MEKLQEYVAIAEKARTERAILKGCIECNVKVVRGKAVLDAGMFMGMLETMLPDMYAEIVDGNEQ